MNRFQLLLEKLVTSTISNSLRKLSITSLKLENEVFPQFPRFEELVKLEESSKCGGKVTTSLIESSLGPEVFPTPSAVKTLDSFCSCWSVERNKFWSLESVARFFEL